MKKRKGGGFLFRPLGVRSGCRCEFCEGLTGSDRAKMTNGVTGQVFYLCMPCALRLLGIVERNPIHSTGS